MHLLAFLWLPIFVPRVMVPIINLLLDFCAFFFNAYIYFPNKIWFFPRWDRGFFSFLFFQFSDIAKVVIIHKKIYSNLAINDI
jgi:hypothetical protein